MLLSGTSDIRWRCRTQWRSTRTYWWSTARGCWRAQCAMLNQTRHTAMNDLTHDCAFTASRCASVSLVSHQHDVNSTYCDSSPFSARFLWRWNVVWRCPTSRVLFTTWLVRGSVNSLVLPSASESKQRHMHCDLWTIKRWQCICDHNFGKSRSIFIIFALL